MTIEVRVPQLPESVADATIVSWHKKPGDWVARDENLVDLETDKVVLEVPAPAAGVLKEITLKDGTSVTSGQVLAILEEGATALPGASAPAIMASDSAATTAKESTESVAGKLSPAAKRVLEENQVDPKAVTGSRGACSGVEGRGASAAAGRRRRARRTARADDPAARAHRRAHGAGAGHPSAADLIQRSGFEGRQ